MNKQNFELKNEKIILAFNELKRKHPEKFKNRINLSWSNWGFGLETFHESVERLHKAGIKYIELHGNHYGADLGYKPKKILRILGEHDMKVGGVCGMFSVDNDLSSNSAIHRQAAIDYIKREIEFLVETNGEYLLVVPGAVGRPVPYDNAEFDRSVDTLRIVADLFVENGIKAAIEPVRSAEVSFIHTVRDAKRYIDVVNHPGVCHINGDVYHMQSEEAHIGEAILDCEDMLVNLHMADSNRGALGDGFMDLDIIIMALYLLDYNREGRFVTPEPLGPGGAPYPAMHGRPDKEFLDRLVINTINYFRERESILVS